MNILVTGGAGFIGSHTADACVEHGHNVVVVDSLFTGNREFVPAEATFYQVDIRDFESIQQIVWNHDIEAIFHFAAHMDARAAVNQPVHDADMNVRGSIHILEAARHHGVKQVIMASTGGVMYGEHAPIPTPESEMERPNTPYAVSKLSMEKYAQYYQDAFGINYAALRYSNVYGPRQNSRGEAGVIAIFTDRLLSGEPCTIFGDGTITRDFIHVSDVTAANMTALQREVTGVFNISTAQETSVNTVYETVAQEVGIDTPAEHGAAKPGEQSRSCLAYDKWHTATGWTPHFSFPEGVKDTVAWFKDRA